MIRLYRKLFNHGERLLIGKDFGNIWKNNTMRSIIILLPLIFAVLIPAAFLIVICVTSDPVAVMFIRGDIAEILPDYYVYTAKQQQFIFFEDYVSTILYLVIPTIISSLTTILLFVGERENETIGTLLTSLNAKSILKAKLTCSFINSMVMSVVSFFAVFILNSIGNLLLSIPFFFNLEEWILILFLLTPVLILLSSFFTLLLTHNNDNIIHSISICGYIGAPLTLWFIGQFSGIFSISYVSYLILSFFIILFDIAVYKFKLKNIDDAFLIGTN